MPYTPAMHQRLAWALALLPLALLAGCKVEPSEEPAPPRRSALTSGYDARAFQAQASIRPLDVCEHLARMVAAEAGIGEQPVDAQMMAQCEAELSMEAGVRGTDNWNDIAACVLAAGDEADLDGCEQRYPLPAGPGGPGAPSSGGTPGDLLREREVCEHMIQVILRDGAAEQGEAPQLSAEEFLGLREQCVGSLVEEQRPYLPPEDYALMLDCITRAESGAQLRACQ